MIVHSFQWSVRFWLIRHSLCSSRMVSRGRQPSSQRQLQGASWIILGPDVDDVTRSLISVLTSPESCKFFQSNMMHYKLCRALIDITVPIGKEPLSPLRLDASPESKKGRHEAERMFFLTVCCYCKRSWYLRWPALWKEPPISRWFTGATQGNWHIYNAALTVKEVLRSQRRANVAARGSRDNDSCSSAASAVYKSSVLTHLSWQYGTIKQWYTLCGILPCFRGTSVSVYHIV